MNKLKQKFTKYPLCIELLYDAGFVKSANNKRLTFSINNMKLLKKVDKILKKEFESVASMLREEEEENTRLRLQEIAANKEREQAMEPIISGSFANTLLRMSANNTIQNEGWQKISLF